MNRLMHLRETLPVNIMENSDYPDLEFVILDYNSQDGMESWAKEALMPHIESGRVVYYKNYDARYFDLSHSKNMLVKLATGDIICLLDADNYAGLNYASWVDRIFSGAGRDTVITVNERDRIRYRDQGGKICCSRENIYSVKGFDESFQGYGVDDVDLVNRLEKAGGQRVLINNEEFLKYIGHSMEERIKNNYLFNNVDAIYTYISSLEKVKAVFLLKDNTFLDVDFEFSHRGQQNLVSSFSGWRVGENGRKKGTFARADGSLTLFGEDRTTVIPNEIALETLNMDQVDTKPSWKKIDKGHELYHTAVISYGECMNRRSCVENDKNSRLVNQKGWGMGTVFMNFDNTTPIKVS